MKFVTLYKALSNTADKPYLSLAISRRQVNPYFFCLVGSKQSNRLVSMPDIRPLSIELAKKAQDELGETPERVKESLEAARAWLAKSPHIKARQDDQFLVSFLRGVKFSMEKFKEKFDLFYSLRNAIPDIYHDRHPKLERVQELMKLG